MSKKLTPTIAKALAEKVRANLKAKLVGADTQVRQAAESSKEWKRLVKLYEERKKIVDEMNSLSTEIEKKYSTDVASVSVSVYSTHSPELRVRENSLIVSLESIRDTILIEDYMSGGTETPEEMIERITNKILNPQS